MALRLRLSKRPVRRTITGVKTRRDAFPGPVPLARLCGWAGLAGFTAFLLVGILESRQDGLVLPAVGIAVGLAAAAAFFVTRLRFPLVYAGAATAGVALIGNGHSSGVVWFCTLLLGAWCVLAVGTGAGVLYGAATVLLFVGEFLFTTQDQGWAPWTAAMILIVAVAVLVRHQLVLVEKLRAAQADLAERSRAEERNRIARELHDVIAHSLTVSLLHITSARLAVENEPVEAASALAEAERLARQSLTEVRATMGVLRSGPGGALAAPMPDVAQLNELVDDLRRAGADASLVVDGDVSGVPATVGATIFRIAQEALTNAAKHAPGASVSVRLDASSYQLELWVESAGLPRHGSGLGLGGMKERAEAMGGSLTAGPGGRGWLVHACVPLQTVSRTASP
jgi:signal transduction histidine kinase